MHRGSAVVGAEADVHTNHPRYLYHQHKTPLRLAPLNSIMNAACSLPVKSQGLWTVTEAV